jgi:hypothetical protein
LALFIFVFNYGEEYFSWSQQRLISDLVLERLLLGARLPESTHNGSGTSLLIGGQSPPSWERSVSKSGLGQISGDGLIEAAR